MREYSSRNMCQVACVTCHVSRVTCHLSHDKIFFYTFFYLKKKIKKNNILTKIWQSGGTGPWTVCYQQGLHRLVYNEYAKKIGFRPEEVFKNEYTIFMWPTNVMISNFPWLIFFLLKKIELKHYITAQNFHIVFFSSEKKRSFYYLSHYLIKNFFNL